MRGAGAFVAGSCLFYAATLLPLGEFMAITFTRPILASVGAILFLGEIARGRRWTAIFVGFAGALIVVRPGFQVINIGTIFILASQAVSQLHHRTIILFAISAKLQKLFINRYNQAFFTNSCQNIGYFFMVLRLLCYLSTAKLSNQAGNADNTDHSGNIKAAGQNRSLGPNPFKAAQQKAGDF